MTETQATGEQTPTTIPPYIAFRTITDITDRMEQEEPPARIDKSYLENYSGGYRTQVIAALNTLGLRGPNGEVETRLKELIQADAARRKEIMADIVREQYADILLLGGNATQQQLIDAFKEMGVNPGDTMRKVIAFFLNACRYSGLTVSRHWRVPAVSSSGRKKTPARGTAAVDVPGAPEGEPAGPGPSGNPNVRVLPLRSGGTVTLSVSVNLFELSDEDQVFVLGLIKKIREYGPIEAEAPAADEDDDDPVFEDDDEAPMA